MFTTSPGPDREALAAFVAERFWIRQLLLWPRLLLYRPKCSCQKHFFCGGALIGGQSEWTGGAENTAVCTNLAVLAMVCQAQDFEGVLVADVGVEVASEHFSVSLVEVYPSSCELYHVG